MSPRTSSFEWWQREQDAARMTEARDLEKTDRVRARLEAALAACPQPSEVVE